MKLQGKKTGVVANFIGYIDQTNPTTFDPMTGNTLLTVRYIDAGVNCYKDYRTIAEFNKDWEDYKPDEPLIKDEKIRKAVRAWAEASEVNLQDIKVCTDTRNTEFVGWRNDETKGIGVEFRNPAGVENVENGEHYTITELCGEIEDD